MERLLKARPRSSASCTVTTVRAPIEEILPFLHYHLNIGIDHMFFFFDDPADPAANVLANYPRISTVLCTPEHWQKLGKGHTAWLPDFNGTRPPLTEDRQNLNATVALGMARARRFEWIAHIDVDELLYAPSGLSALLQRQPRSLDFIRFPVLEAVAQDVSTGNPMEIELFKIAELRLSDRGAEPTLMTRVRRRLNRWVQRLKVFAASLTTARGIFARQGDLIVGHLEGKSFVRTSSKVSCVKCHTPMAAAGSKLRWGIARRAYLLHYDCCNFNQWHMKWSRRCDGTGTLRSMAPHRQRQFASFKALCHAGTVPEMRRLYQGCCLVPERAISILLRLRLLKRVRLSKTLFAAPRENRPGAIRRGDAAVPIH